MLKSNLINALFLGSILFILSLTMFPDTSLGIGSKPGGVNFIPFHTIGGLLFQNSLKDFAVNNLGNIILFIPFGFLLPLNYRGADSTFKACSAGLILSLIIEVLQLFMSNRWTDIDDVILNTIGAGTGYILFRWISLIYK
ncbi:VanZ family protein [Priestia aryabhattai]|uniref:VanZ family protein n=1 Tax=Priestia aryabhattai TaxID=412384 RepID=UPI0015F51414|nr:VanZ family protein [Priestia aryabhattai]